MSADLERGDLLIPFGAFVCAIVALGMLYLKVAAQVGWISGPFAQLVVLGQPPIMTVFYAIAAIASIIVCAYACIQILVRRG